jgi:phage terminase large subunit-like protein
LGPRLGVRPLSDSVQAKLELAKLRRLYRSALASAFDALNPESRATPTQQSVLEDAETLLFWLIGGNRSGKTALGARVMSWWFNNEHPYMDRPAEWGAGPLQMLLLGRVGEQIESEIWERKIKPFLTPGSYKEVRIGGILKRVIHKTNGNRIIFLSHHDAEDAREKAQAFTSHIVWLDEMPAKASLITELVLRVLSNRGRLYATFTPLIRNEEIKKIVETPTATARKVKLLMLDNPIYRGREAEVIEQVRSTCASDAEFRARMYGEWYEGDGRVFSYQADRNLAMLPSTYSAQGWRHLAVLDPAASGKAGLSVLAEDPDTGHWYVVLAKYLAGAAAFELYDVAEREVAPFGRLTRRCDCNPSGFYKESARRHQLGQGAAWLAYSDKNDRKLETIERTNSALVLRRVYLTPEASLLAEELVKATWSERDPNKIVNASSLHLADTLRYAVDLLPAYAGRPADLPQTQTQQIRADWKARQQRDAKARAVRIHQRRGAWKRPLSSLAR